MIKRRSLLGGAAAAAATATLPAPAIAQNRRRYKMVTTWPKNFPGLGGCAQRVAARLSDATDGRITVQVFAADELVPAFQAFDAVATGTADMYHGGEYYWQGKALAFNFFSAVPFGMTATEMAAWIRHGGGQELWDRLSGRFGIKAFMCGNSSVQMGGWFNKEIKSVEDFRGLKFRMAGLGGEVLRRLGAATEMLPGPEVFPALRSGRIDGTEWVGPWNDLAFGLHKIAKYYYWPGFHEPGSVLALGVNRDVYEDMSKADRALLRTVCDAETAYTLAEFDANNARALEVLVREHGVALRRFDDAVLKRLAEVSAEVVAEVAAVDDLSKAIHDSFMAERRQIMEWSRIGIEAFVQARRLTSTL
jgi:TRAP-type mannitol/chloroaromatic compound transport system substrate-binding protein